MKIEFKNFFFRNKKKIKSNDRHQICFSFFFSSASLNIEMKKLQKLNLMSRKNASLSFSWETRWTDAWSCRQLNCIRFSYLEGGKKNKKASNRQRENRENRNERTENPAVKRNNYWKTKTKNRSRIICVFLSNETSSSHKNWQHLLQNDVSLNVLFLLLLRKERLNDQEKARKAE